MFGINLLFFYFLFFYLAYYFILVIKMKGHYINVVGYHEFYSTAYHWFFYEGKEKPKRLTGLYRIGLQRYLSNDKTDLNFSCLFFPRKNTIPIFQDFQLICSAAHFLIRCPFKSYWHKFFLLFPFPGAFSF